MEFCLHCFGKLTIVQLFTSVEYECPTCLHQAPLQLDNELTWPINYPQAGIAAGDSLTVASLKLYLAHFYRFTPRVDDGCK
jgi:hypothetical protein